MGLGNEKFFKRPWSHMTKMAAMPIYGKNVNGHSNFKVKTCFAETVGFFWNKSSYESLRENGNENLYK